MVKCSNTAQTIFLFAMNCTFKTMTMQKGLSQVMTNVVPSFFLNKHLLLHAGIICANEAAYISNELSKRNQADKKH